jgi:hypothetical protein
MNRNQLINKLVTITLIITLTLGCRFATSIFQTSTPAPNPVNMEVKLNEQRSSSAVISPEGGTLRAQGADGTKFTLTFPKYAISIEETITLTPISAINGLPFSGGLVAGVQMAPEGLRLLQPAMLTIESPKAFAASGFQTVAFAYRQNGDGLYLNPSEAKGNLLTIEIWHFSGAGAAQGTPAEIQTQQARVPSNAEDALTQGIQEYISMERDAQLHGQEPDPQFGNRLTELIQQDYDRNIAPLLPIALTDCAQAQKIIPRALSWERQATLLGGAMATRFQPQVHRIREDLVTAMINCYNKEYDQCVIDKDIAHRRPMLGFYRDALMLGSSEAQLDYSKIEKCPPVTGYMIDGPFGKTHIFGEICSLDVSFKLNWDSEVGLAGTITFSPSSENGGTWTLEGTLASGGVTNAGAGSYTIGKNAENTPSTLVLDGTSSQTTVGYGTINFPVKEVIQLNPSKCSHP